MHSAFQLLLLASVLAASHQKLELVRCDGGKNHSFCWWAVDIVATARKPHLYHNGKSAMIENNINRICNAANHSRYGISFVDVSLFDGENIKILAEVSYYCCKNCSEFKRYDEQKKIENLLDHYYKKRLEPLLDTDKYCFNINSDKEKNIVDDAPCIFILNHNSKMKVYSGPMLWNQIDQTIFKIRHLRAIDPQMTCLSRKIRKDDINSLASLFRIDNGCNNISTIGTDEKCWQVPGEYFVFCCCWSNPFNCTYSPKTELITEKNKEIWLKLAKIRNPKSALETQSIIFGNKFLFAESKGADTIPGLNEPRYHCLHIQFLKGEKFLYNWIVINPEKIQSRYRFCTLTIAVSFQNNKIKSNKKVIDPNPKGSKGSWQLIISDIFDKSEIRPFTSCYHQSSAYLRVGLVGAAECVRSFDFQSRTEIFMNERKLIRYTLAQQSMLTSDRKRNLTCTIYHTHPLEDPYCHLNTSFESERTIFQYYSCTCETKNINAQSEQCDVGSDAQIFSPKDWNRPTCFFTNTTDRRPLYIFGKEIPMDSFQEISEHKTIETPICVMALSISNFGLFYRLHTFHYPHFQLENGIAARRFSVTKEKSFSTYTTLCNSNRTISCNNKIDLIRHLLTYVIHIHSKTKIPQSYDRCTVFENTKRIERCSSSLGCYSFNRLDKGKVMTGCVDRIPALVRKLPNLSPLAWCRQITYQENRYRCRAYKGTTNLTTSGILCCCQKDCFIMMDEDEYGFNPFEIGFRS
uniref:Kringle domain-containing protein n=1 Tax=Onchocerca volvulus TaxID=6282 RepID=A0A8R1TK23_ONCVO